MPMPFFSKNNSSKKNLTPENDCNEHHKQFDDMRQDCKTEILPKHKDTLEAKLFEGVLQPECGTTSQVDAAVFKTLPEASKKRDVVWVPVTPDKLSELPDLELMRALQRRNKGILDGVPDWIFQGLAHVSGPVDWLVKVRTPAGLKKGSKFPFVYNGVKAEATYNGAAKSTGLEEVYAVSTPLRERELVWVDIASANVDALKQLELMRALEQRNKGATDGVPRWMQEGLAAVRPPVEWLVKVAVPSNVKRGDQVPLNLNGEKTKVVFTGDPARAATHAVFALLGQGARAASASKPPATNSLAANPFTALNHEELAAMGEILQKRGSTETVVSSASTDVNSGSFRSSPRSGIEAPVVVDVLSKQSAPSKPRNKYQLPTLGSGKSINLAGASTPAMV